MADTQHKKNINEEDDLMLGSRMSFGDHLEELRTRLIRSLKGLGIALVVCLIFGKYIFGFIAEPLVIALQASDQPVQLYVSSLPEMFVTYIKVALYTAIFISSPWIFYQLWGFIAAGLYARERRYVHVFAPFAAILFILGGLFFLWVVAPLSCSFFIRFGSNITTPVVHDNFVSRLLLKALDQTDSSRQNSQDDNATPETEQTPPEKPQPLIKPWFTLQNYVTLMVLLALAFSVAFQMPLAVFFLGRLGMVSLKTLRTVRKYVFFGILIVAAIMTPPDVVSQIALALPMYALYEIGILLLWVWPKKN